MTAAMRTSPLSASTSAGSVAVATTPGYSSPGVVMSTPGELYPGVVPTATEPADVEALKGDVRMAAVIAEAVKRRQRTIPTGRPLDVEGTVIQLQPRYIRDAREHARRTRAPHNVARKT